MEEEELFIMVKGDKTKANGLKLGIKTIQDKRNPNRRSTEQYHNPQGKSSRHHHWMYSRQDWI